MRRWTYLVVAALLVLGACGSSNDEPASADKNTPGEASSPEEPEESPSAPPVEESEIAGTLLHELPYKTDLFSPAFAFKGVNLGYPFEVDLEQESVIVFAKGPAYQAVALTRPDQMYADDNVSLTKPPANLVDWFKDNRNLETTDGPPLNVGGVEVPALDVTIASVPKEQPAELPCPTCVAIHPVEGGLEPIAMDKTEEVRAAQIEVKGEKILVMLVSPKSDFDQFMKDAGDLLKTFSWK
jgi:hypothetical protein